MKNNKSFLTFILNTFSLLIISTLFINMGGGGSASLGLEPEFIELRDGEGFYSGKIYDEQSIVDVREISFTGNTSIGGVRKESDDSVNVLDFSIIKEIQILKPDYMSKRFSDKDFMLVAVQYVNDNEKKEFLVPRKVVVCALEAKTGQKKAWLLNKTKKIVIERAPKQIPVTEVEVTQESDGGIVETIKSGWTRVTETVSP